MLRPPKKKYLLKSQLATLKDALHMTDTKNCSLKTEAGGYGFL
jgi:hypothetical protein